MSQLVVSSSEDRSFLDRVIDHGVGHSLLSDARRQFLAESCDATHANLCAQFRLNEWEPGETLEVASIATMLLGLALEEKSVGDVSCAVKILQENAPGALILGKLAEIEKHFLRVKRLQKSVFIGQTQFGYSVMVCKVREWSGGKSGLLLFNFAEPMLWSLAEHKAKELLRICRALQNLATYRLWTTDLDQLEYEYAVSQRYLPWAQLQQEAQFVSLSDNVGADITWTLDTLIATMAATLAVGGSNYISGFDRLGRTLSLGTIFPRGHLSHLGDSLKIHGYFRNYAGEKFVDYLDNSLHPDERARKYLWLLFESAMDKLLAEPLPGKSDVFSWSERLHIEVDGERIESSMRKRKAFRASPIKKRHERIIDAVEAGKPRSSVERMLKNLDWAKATADGFLDELFLKLDPELVVTHMPLLPEMVERLCAFWNTTQGQQVWKTASRRQLSKRLIAIDSREFWRQLPEDAVIALAEAWPERAKEFRSRIL